MENIFDLVVIGSGPAGYVGAIRASQLGLKVAIVEKYNTLGGTCLNVGCIPSKALLQSSEKFYSAKRHFAEHGISFQNLKYDFSQMQNRKSDVVKQLTTGINYLMNKNDVTIFTGSASFETENFIKIEYEGKTQLINAKNVMIATGSKPIELPFMKFDKDVILSSTEALSLSDVPESMAVIGAGVIGLELGSVYSRLGCDVTVLDASESILSVMDKDLRAEGQKLLQSQGLRFSLGVSVKSCQVSEGVAYIGFEDSESNLKTLAAQKVLVAVGRKPNTDGLSLENASVELNARGQVIIDDQFRTSQSNIFAVGDCVPGPMLAHKAEEEAIICAEIIAGHKAKMNYATIPGVVYTHPEIASVGLTEQELTASGKDFNIGKFSFKANGRAIAMGETEGFVKIIADKVTDRVLGVHIIGPNASELIAEAAIALEFSSSAEDLAKSVHAHPTLSEVLKEAALDVNKLSLHK
ncbi:MAG TPA: dihydrolipoyl dehydrogenase [Alphaproteobacteria bacterium]|nr:dihydrolipoyl dehydrogenase [Alphaproteobacteria bacterium]